MFDRPDELLLDRTVNPHLAFGLNIHFCLGAPLARLETRVAVPRLLTRGAVAGCAVHGFHPFVDRAPPSL